MFSINMSYYEIISALRETPSLMHLSKFQKNCLCSSLRNPFVSALFNLYPVSEHIKNIIEKLLQVDAAVQPLNLNVHNSVLSEQRARTKDYLFLHFDRTVDSNIISKLEAFITSALAHQEIMDELILSYKTRVFESKDYQMSQSQIDAVQSEIVTDFGDYLIYLKSLKDTKSTYSWGVLSALLRRINLQSEEEAKLSAQLELMRALDDSRTAYFHEEAKFEPTGKDYSCPQGLEERCLDHHAYLAQAVVQKEHEAQIQKLFSPFLQSVKDQHGLHSKYVCSPLLINTYAHFAGYKAYARERMLFEIPQSLTEEQVFLLKTQYLAFKHSITVDEVTRLIQREPTAAHHVNQDSSQALISPRKIMLIQNNQINTLIATIRAGCAAYPTDSLPEFIKFWQSQQHFPHLIETPELPQDLEFVHDGQHRTKDQIIDDMVDVGPFVDKSHLLTIETLIPFEKIEEMLQADPTVPHLDDTALDKKTVIDNYRAVKTRLTALYRDYYDFYLPELDSAMLLSQHLYAPICSEEVFLYFLKKHKSDFLMGSLSHKKLEKYALLSVTSSYNRVLLELLSEFDLSPNIYFTQERKILLEFACEVQNVEAVKILLNFGSALKGDHSHRHPIHIAAKSGNIEIMKDLLQYGADINAETTTGNYTPLMLAIQESQMGTARKLIEFGADLSKTNIHNNTALSFFSNINWKRPDVLDVLTLVLVSLKTNRDLYNKIVNSSELVLPGSASSIFENISADSVFLNVAMSKNNPKIIDKLMQYNKELGISINLDLFIPILANHAFIGLTRHCLMQEYLTIESTDSRGFNVLDYAIIRDKPRLVRYLMKLYSPTGSMPVRLFLISTWFKAAKLNAVKVMSMLKAQDASLLQQVDSYGRTAFFYAVADYSYQACYLRIYKQAFDFSYRDNYGDSVLVMAAAGKMQHERESLYFLIEQCRNSMTTEDFEVQYAKAMTAALAFDKAESFVVLATYNEKYLVEQSLAAISSRREELQELFNSYKGSEVKIFALLAWRLLRFKSEESYPRPTSATIDIVALEMLSQIEYQLQNRINLSQIDMALLNYTIKFLWGIGGLAIHSSHSPILLKYTTNIGLPLSSQNLEFLKILHKSLSIRLNYLPKSDCELIIGRDNNCQKIIQRMNSTQGAISPAKKEILSCLLSNILSYMKQSNETIAFKGLLQELHKVSDLLTAAVSVQENPQTVLFLLLNYVFMPETITHYNAIISSAMSYCKRNNKKNLVLFFDCFSHIFYINDTVTSTSMSHTLLIERLKNVFEESWPIENLLGLVALLDRINTKYKELSHNVDARIKSNIKLQKTLVEKVLLEALEAIENGGIIDNILSVSDASYIILDSLGTLLKSSSIGAPDSNQPITFGVEVPSWQSFLIEGHIQKITTLIQTKAQELESCATTAAAQQPITFSKKRSLSPDLTDGKRFKK